ncbi:MAG TPA: SPFH/Band 7/PHB domain protein, partial [Blastococcus sp.]|nr:SPFH/Band 7/PHB domain protein [Blastococcus sp.]
GLANLGGADGGKSWMDVGTSAGGGSGPKDGGLDTSSWFESQLPRAADQPEARIELSSISDSTPAIATPPPLSQVTEDVRDSGPAADPAVREQFGATGDGQPRT